MTFEDQKKKKNYNFDKPVTNFTHKYICFRKPTLNRGH